MLVGIFQLLQARQNEAQARRDFIEAQREYWSARTDLDRALQGIAADTSFTPATTRPDDRPAQRRPLSCRSHVAIVLFSSVAGAVTGCSPARARSRQRCARRRERSAAEAAAARSAAAAARRSITPNGSRRCRIRMVDGVKEFHLIAEPVRREFVDGLNVNCWGYNGSTPGPTIEAFEGDRVRILVTNKLPEGTSVHWHGFILPNGMDGVSGLNQPKIAPGETFAYEFTLKQTGTLMYHPHFDEMVQIALGMHGFFIIHPRDAERAPRRSRLRDLSQRVVHQAGNGHARSDGDARLQHLHLQLRASFPAPSRCSCAPAIACASASPT